jgi:hypothetical protein
VVESIAAPAGQIPPTTSRVARYLRIFRAMLNAFLL